MNRFFLIILILLTVYPFYPIWPNPIQLSPPMLIEQAIKKSGTIAQARSSLIAIHAEQLRMEAQFATTFTASGKYTDNQWETSNSLMPTDSKTYDYQLGVNKRFWSGTMLQASFKHSDFQGPTFQLLPPGIPGIAPTQYFTSQLSLGLRQDLWKNSLGYAYHQQLNAINLRQQNQKLLASLEIENYLMNIFEQYYQAESLVATVAIKNLRKEREEKRLKLYQQHFDRGFLEQTDLLQLQTAVIDSQQQLMEAKFAVERILILLEQEIKLPLKQIYQTSEGEIEFATQPVDDVLPLCQKNQAFTHSFLQTINHQQLQEIEHLLAANTNGRYPDLALETAISANGIDASFAQGLKEISSLQHPQFSVGISFTYAFGGEENRSQQLELTQRKEKTLTESTKIADQLKSAQELLCTQLGLGQEKLKLLTQKQGKEQQRVQLLDNKYQVGKTDINTLVLAEDVLAATTTQIILLKQQTHLAAWKIRQGTGKLQPLIDQALTQDKGP